MRVLVITAHPHYAGTFCAGTIYNHTQPGDDVFVASLTDGDLMTNMVSREELAEINKRDMREAAKVLGVKEVRFLGFQDGEVENNLDVKIALNNTIRELKPDIALTHWYQSTLPDFKATGEATIDALFCALLVSGRWAEKLPSHWTSKAYAFQDPGLSVGFKPTVFIDISESIEAKVRAIDCFMIHCEANYGGDIERFRSSIISANEYWALEAGFTRGVEYVEPYMQIDIHERHNRAVKFLPD